MDNTNPLIQALLEENEALKKDNLFLREKIAELEKRLDLNSKNSSKPPSSDGFKKAPPKSLREKGKNPSGGKTGHKGYTLKQVAHPDTIILHEIKICSHCQGILNKEADRIVKRQVFDIPPVKLEVTEHQVEIKICPGCKKEVRASFPCGVNVPAQYGPKIKAQAAYLSAQHYIPEDRLQIIFKDLYNAEIATATLVKFSNDLSFNLIEFCDFVLEKIKRAALKHMDETGYRVKGKLNWLHVTSNDKLTYYHHAEKRGAMLSGISGIVVHDHWKPYYQMKIKHALCNAHHLRELEALIEYDKESWARKMKRLLLFTHKYRRFFDDGVPEQKIIRLEKIYDRIIKEGMEYHLKRREQLLYGGKFTRKRYPGHNLLLRLDKYREDVLRFLHNPAVPFTNNQAEQDIRMMKLKQKISGGFRTTSGTDVFVRLRTFFSTIRKQNLDIFTATTNAINGELPTLIC